MDITNNIIIMFLIFSRISGMFLLAPVFSNRNIPLHIKLGFTVFLTYITFPLVSYSSKIQINSNSIILYFLISEFFIGLFFGFICILILNSVYIAGLLVDRNIGFSIVNVISPQDESEIPITANLYYIIAIMVFLMTNSHHKLINAILNSFKTIPLGYEVFNLLYVERIVKIITSSFILGFKMASPIIITIIITNILLGILSRTIPQMNVFIVGMPLKIFIGLITLFLILPVYFKLFNNIFYMMFEYIKEFLSTGIKG